MFRCILSQWRDMHSIACLCFVSFVLSFILYAIDLSALSCAWSQREKKKKSECPEFDEPAIPTHLPSHGCTLPPSKV
jgi:hypothetical protein